MVRYVQTVAAREGAVRVLPIGCVTLGRKGAELADLNETLAAMKRRWENEKQCISKARDLKERVESARTDADRAEKEAALERAAELRYGAIPELEAELEEQNRALTSLQEGGAMLNEEVGEEEIAAIVSRWTGIPVSRLLQGEVDKLVHLEDRIHRAAGDFDKRLALWLEKVENECRGVSPHLIGALGVGGLGLALVLIAVVLTMNAASIAFRVYLRGRKKW